MVRTILRAARVVFIVLCVAATVLAAVACVIAFAFALAFMLAGRSRRPMVQRECKLVR